MLHPVAAVRDVPEREVEGGGREGEREREREREGGREREREVEGGTTNEQQNEALRQLTSLSG